jgi:hypothetical protein
VDDASPGDSLLSFRSNNSGNLELSPANVAGILKAAWPADISAGHRATNLQTLTIDTSLTAYKSGCGLMSEDGDIQALWLGSHCYDISTVVPIIKQIEAGEIPKIRSLGVYLENIETVDARAMGLPDGNQISIYTYALLIS